MAGKQVIDPGWGYEKEFGYSQAVRAGNLVFLAGQMPVDAQCNVVAEGDIVGQARLLLGAILRGGGPPEATELRAGMAIR